ncbi:MAG: hypothetical protein FH749_11220 [Firmicutes bacterium]|nr:hypothetical protein [Bacillota bacterium]
MSHLHLPDGVLPAWLALGALLVMLTIVLWSLFLLERQRRLLPTVAVMAAVVLVALNIPLGLPLHLNLAALAGIMVGPWFGFLAVFIVNIFSSLVGHGGWTVLGINTLLVGSEALVAGALFGLLGAGRALMRNVSVSVVVALLVSTALVVGVVYLAGIELEALVEHDHGHEVDAGHGHGHGFLEQFLKIVAPLLAIWLALELLISLGAMRFIKRVRGGV